MKFYQNRKQVNILDLRVYKVAVHFDPRGCIEKSFKFWSFETDARTGYFFVFYSILTMGNRWQLYILLTTIYRLYRTRFINTSFIKLKKHKQYNRM